MELYVTKKMPRNKVPKLRHIQATKMLRLHRRVSEAEIIGEAIDELDRKESLASRLPEKRKTLDDITGFFKYKGGKKYDSSKDLDDVVYGEANKS